MIEKSANRMKELRERWRAAGYKLRHVWVHPSDWKRVQALVEKLIDKRGRPKP